LLVHAAGGDVRREPELEAPAVAALASDLDHADRREQLAHALSQLDDEDPTLARLRADPELAWRAYACGLLAEALGE